MLLEFYGLREQPFGVTPDPRFLYLSPAYREALASLYYWIESGRGFLGLIAKPGMGKTTLLFQLLQKCRGNARTALLCHTQCSSREFMRFLLAELGSEGDEKDFVRMHDELKKLTLQEARAGRSVIVVVDEAQNLHPSVLETIRLLSNFETPRAKLLQIILAGQPQLADKLASREVSQLRRRISVLNGLSPLSAAENSKYIVYRLRIAGYSGGPLFAPAALRAIAQFAEGIPRTINNFCFNALSLGFALGQRAISVAVVEEVISDCDITKHVAEAPSLLPSDRKVDRVPSSRNFSVPCSTACTTGNQVDDTLTPDEAKAYMQQFAWKVRVLKRKRCRTPVTAPSSQDHDETVRGIGFDSGGRQ